MRISLARALFSSPDILLLDEPTNHLDFHACVWLEEYLQNRTKTLLLVSHQRDFLNNVCTDIIHIQGGKLHDYKGNYDTFESVRATKNLQQHREYVNQQKDREKLEEFVSKFTFNATNNKLKSGSSKLASQAQSRLKMLEKMEVIEDAIEDQEYIPFLFPDPDPIFGIPLQFREDVSFGYAEGPTLFEKVNFTIDMKSRLALVGPNGVGKSTLLKLFIGELESRTGVVIRNNKLRLGYFSQHFVDNLNMEQTAIQYLSSLHEAKIKAGEMSVQEIRNKLARFGIVGQLAVQPINLLSGGQKSRVIFAKLALQNPQILLLDEPTNHLDIDAIDALVRGLQAFKGGVVVVSHDERLMSKVCDELWMCREKQVIRFNGTFEQYKKLISTDLSK